MNLSIFLFKVKAFFVFLKKFYLPQGDKRYSLRFSSRKFIVFHLTFQSNPIGFLFFMVFFPIHMCGVRLGVKIHFFHMDNQLTQEYLLKTLFCIFHSSVTHLFHKSGDHLCVDLFLDSILTVHCSIYPSFFQ